MDFSKFPPVQRRMLTMLWDGERHTKKELHTCLADDLGELRNVKHHIHALRKKLRPLGFDIVCEILDGHRGTSVYRQVRLLHHPNRD
jgi:DNA-binding response OmpR family regulator